ncbi:unnamed protein product [Urochloa decumbens]|uniref:Jacalin-type lectin domain-containing protein n=1 Tax=Urochloa decumbens TaxID=240449 RepID=A0ABC9BB49_9POAL
MMANNKLKLSGAAVLLVIVVPLFMYAGALLIGVQLGRALERSPDSVSVSFSIRGALAYLAKELWYSNNNVLGLGRRGGKAAQVWVAARLVRPESADMEQSNKHRRSYIPFPRSVEGRDNSSAAHKAHRHYTNHTHTSPRGVISVGPWGGSGGQPFYMLRGSSGAPRLHSITLQHSPSGIHSLACQYVSGDSRRFRMAAGPWGRPQSSTGSLLHATINLPAGEHVTAVEGTVGHFATVPGAVVTSLAFRTNAGTTYGPYGRSTAGTPFSVPAADGACIVGFWGRSGWLLDAIGVYMKPCSSNPAYYKAAMRRQG